MFFKRNKNQESTDQHDNEEAPIAAQEMPSDKVKNIIKQLKNDQGRRVVNAEMAVNVKLDTAELVKSINELKEALCGTTGHHKIHELLESEQPIACYSNECIGYYSAFIYSPETIELLKKPNTRLAIIEEDEDETV